MVLETKKKLFLNLILLWKKIIHALSQTDNFVLNKNKADSNNLINLACVFVQPSVFCYKEFTLLAGHLLLGFQVIVFAKDWPESP